jgi:hypothetical protein
MTMMVTLRDPDTGAIRTVPSDETAGYDSWEIVCEHDGPPPEGAVIQDGTWVVPLTVLQDRAWETVKGIREEKLRVAPTSFGVAQTDLESMAKINGLVSMAMLATQSGAPFAETFTMADNSEVDMDAGQMIQFGLAVGTHIAAVHAKARDLRRAIYEATREELPTIDLVDGWPSTDPIETPTP